MEKLNTFLIIILMLIVIGLNAFRSTEVSSLNNTVYRTTEETKKVVEKLEKTGVQPLAGLGSKELLQGTEEIQGFCEQVLGDIVKGDIDAGFNLMAMRSIHPKSVIDEQKELTKRQLVLLEPRFGKALEYEFVRAEASCNSVVLYVYIIKYEMHILRWQFFFYKPQDKWVLNTFMWDDKLQEL